MYRKSVIFLFLASFADAMLTDIGLRLQVITEANPLMRILYENAYPLFYGVKLSLPLLLILISEKTAPQPFHKALLGVAFTLYTGVMLLHSYWMWNVLL